MQRFLLGLILFFATTLASAQQWPAKPVRFIVPYPPGGTVDPLARLTGARLQESLGQPFVVENRPGAGGAVGTAAGAKSAPDGYTFVFVFDAHATHHALLSNPGFDTLKDFAPVMLVGTAPYAIAANSATPFQNFSDVVRAAKAKPDSVSIGSIGNGTLAHLIITLAQQAGGFKLIHVPYLGGGPMTKDLLGGQVQLGIGSAALLGPQVRAGKVRGVAVTGEKRFAGMPDVPTLAEQGIAGVNALAWWGVVAPAGTPAPILQRFHAELTKALQPPEMRKRLGDTLGMELVVSSPEEMQKFLTAEMERWGKVIRENRIRAD